MHGSGLRSYSWISLLTDVMLREDEAFYPILRPGPARAFKQLSVFLCKSELYGAFVWVRRALNRPFR